MRGLALARISSLLTETVGSFAIVLTTRRSNVDNAAAHAAEHRGVPPLDETLDFEPAPPDTVVP